MTPQRVTFYVYAENEQEVKELQSALNDFVRSQYNKGILVTAQKMIGALAKFGNNFLVSNFLKSR
jgi:bifunctional ADP-heptose synthase (sugar kinase/adenylyltransferase)